MSDDLMQGDAAPFTDPFAFFADWFAAAEASEINDPNAMSVATSTPDGRPSVRALLLKGVERGGFVFYGNLESRKAQHLAGNPFAALLFHWKSLRRQIRIEGSVTRVSAAEADAYYAQRPHGSRLGAWASQQSRPLDSRRTLIDKVASLQATYPEGSPVPRPPHWGGWHLEPSYFEFWQDREFRLHDRFTFTRDGDIWRIARIYP